MIATVKGHVVIIVVIIMTKLYVLQALHAMRHEGVHLAYAMLSRMQAVGLPPDVTPGCMKVTSCSFHAQSSSRARSSKQQAGHSRGSLVKWHKL